MTSPAKTFAAVLLVVGAVVLSVARPAAAATPCWKTLLNDWYDGRIDHTYALHCYTDALKHLPPDVRTYSSAHDDIERALQSAIAKETKAHQKVGPNTPIPPPAQPTGGGTSTVVVFGGKGANHPPELLATSNGPSPPGGAGVGRKTPGGVVSLVDKLNPGSADSLPLPLLVLGGLALLLVAAGAAGLVVKQVRARRPGA
jgi:hypothetical protein